MVESPTTAQHLIEDCQGLVRSLAIRIRKKLSSHVELDDLVADGQIGLVEPRAISIRRRGEVFDLRHFRIRGANLRRVSRMSWMGQIPAERNSLRTTATTCAIGERVRSEGAGVEPPSSIGLASEHQRRAGDNYSPRRGTRCGAIRPSDDLERGPERTAITREIRERLRQLVDSLPAEAGALIRAVYFEDQTLEEAGRRIGVSKSWASRLHARALSQLARSLRAIDVTS